MSRADQITIPKPSKVSFVQEGELVSVLPDKEYGVLSVLPEVERELVLQHSIFNQNPELFTKNQDKARVGEGHRIKIPPYARFNTEYDPEYTQEFKLSDTIYVVGRYGPGSTLERLYLLTHPEFFVGVYYHNDEVIWEGDSRDRLERDRLHVVHNWTEELDTPIQSRLDHCGEIPETFAGLDSLLRRSIRDLQPPARQEVHRKLIDSEFGTSQETVAEQLRDTGRLAKVYEQTESVLDLTVADDRAQIRFELPSATNPRRAVTVSEPALLWECTCPEKNERYATAHWETPPDSCQIHDDSDGELVASAFENDTVGIYYGGLKLYWYNSRDLWPPSLATLRFAEQVAADFDGESATSILDLGTGTGVLGTLLADDLLPVEELIATDWLVQPAVTAAINAAGNLGSLDFGLQVRPEVGIQWARETLSGVDLCVCNPPSLPTPEEHASLQYDHAVAGTELLEAVVRHAPQLGSTVYVAYSTIATEEVEAVCAETGHEIRRLEAVSTPFQIPPVLATEEYLNALEGRGLRHEPKSRHPYWHDVVFASVEW